MARTPFLEKSGSIRVLGAAFVALMLFLVWVTYAFFDKKFVSSEPVYITTQNTGVNLPQNADVKLRGMIVGEVRTIEPHGDGVRLTLAMKPDLLDQIPRDVTAQILPKTLFGEKFVSLIPKEDASAAKLKSGDTIDQASVPIEVEELLNDAYPLLTAVDPANLSYTLTAVSDALSGRGEQLGETFVSFNSYLKQLNPDVPQLVDDLTALGTVAEGYAAAMPDLGRLLGNTVEVGDTLVEKQKDLASFLDAGTRLSNTLTDFTAANGQNFIDIAKDSRPLLEMLADYSVTFPCFLEGMEQIIPRLDSVFRDQMLHIDVKIPPPTTAYGEDEPLSGTKADFDAASSGPAATSGHDIRADNAATPTCLDLEELTAAAKAGDQDTIEALVGKPGVPSDPNSQFTIPAAVYQLVNIKNNHGKFGEAADYQRVAPTSGDYAADGFFYGAALQRIYGALNDAAGGSGPDLSAMLMGSEVDR
ncbi:MAG TPA: MCE family protein [Aeromicrobium sp.]|nr:MCE family protein [Aeromicrobium sp.]